MKLEQKRDKVRSIIEDAKAQFVTVEFIKQDGSLRTMTIQPASMANHLVEEYKSASTEKAVQTRRDNHPNLINVWEITNLKDEAGKKISQARSINIDTVTKIVSDGVIYTFR